MKYIAVVLVAVALMLGTTAHADARKAHKRHKPTLAQAGVICPFYRLAPGYVLNLKTCQVIKAN